MFDTEGQRSKVVRIILRKFLKIGMFHMENPKALCILYTIVKFVYKIINFAYVKETREFCSKEDQKNYKKFGESYILFNENMCVIII